MTDEITPDVEPVIEPDAQDETPKENPNWAEAWGDFTPEPVREHQRKVFEQWDRNYRELESKFQPFRQYEDLGLSPELVSQALQIQDAIVNDPKGFYDRMGTHWGFAQQLQAAQDAAEANPSDYGEDMTPEERRLAELIERQERIIAQQEQSYQESISAQEEQQQLNSVNAELDQLERQNGKFDRERVIKQALMNASTGGNPTVANAYYEVQRERDEWLRSQQVQAPKVMGGGNGIPVQPQAQEGKLPTPEELRARAMSLAKSMGVNFS